jgi:isocitrate/isopropylmalate dehydrogenase
MLLKIAILSPGDGIGPEVTGEAVRVLEAIASTFKRELCLRKKTSAA